METNSPDYLKVTVAKRSNDLPDVVGHHEVANRPKQQKYKSKPELACLLPRVLENELEGLFLLGSTSLLIG